MAQNPRPQDPTPQNPTLLRICGTIGLIGAIFPVLCDAVSWLLAEDYSPLSQSISSLAVGPSSWLLDIGLWTFAVGCVAVAIGMWNWRLAHCWTASLACLVLVAVCVGVVAQVNQYAGTQNPGANIHLWSVCGIGLFFALAVLLAVPGLRTRSARLARYSLGTGIIWVVLCPIYWFFTDEWSGAVERFLAIMMLAWLGGMASRLRDTARDPGWRPARA